MNISTAVQAPIVELDEILLPVGPDVSAVLIFAAGWLFGVVSTIMVL